MIQSLNNVQAFQVESESNELNAQTTNDGFTPKQFHIISNGSNSIQYENNTVTLYMESEEIL